jgi:hypothetical protein
MKINRLVLLTLLLLLAANITYAKGYEVKRQVDEYTVVVKIDRNPPVAGENHVNIKVTDASGRCSCGAKVLIEYSRPAIHGLPALHYKVDTELKRNRYRGTINLSTAGSWNIAIKIMRAGKTSTTTFTVDVE